MDKNDIEKFRRHMGAGKYVKIKNADGTEDEFYFKPLTCDFLPDFLQLTQALGFSSSQRSELNEVKARFRKGEISSEDVQMKQTEIEETNAIKVMEGENSKILVRLTDAMVKYSYPELDEETRKTFILNNFAMLQGVLLELNESLGKGEVDERILKKIEAAKAARNSQTNA